MNNTDFSQTDFEKGAILLFDKPYGWTSFDLVGKTRNLLTKSIGIKKLKVGHAGTLDPLATGLMIICTGKMTKSIESIQNTSKEYYATIELGKTTPSFDLEKPIDKIFPTEHITADLVKEKIQLFKGEIDQIPPLFSAKWLDGQRAYELARQGSEIELKANRITIEEIEIIRFEMPLLEIRVVCSKGTYIRSLARDIGLALESGAHLTALRRTRSGNFDIKNSISIEEFQEKMIILRTSSKKTEISDNQ